MNKASEYLTYYRVNSTRTLRIHEFVHWLDKSIEPAQCAFTKSRYQQPKQFHYCQQSNNLFNFANISHIHPVLHFGIQVD